MVEHIVLVKLKPETTAEQESRLIEMLKGLQTAVPGIIDLTVGPTFTPERSQGFTVGLVVRFHDRQGLAAYGPHPNHVPVKDYIGQIAESVLALDYEF